jgi:hypothetical protein
MAALMSRLKRYIVPICAATVVFAPGAHAWSQTYEQNVVWGAGSSKISATNSITFNYVSFSNPFGGLPQMGTTLCNTSGSCYATRWSNTGLITDERAISYGWASCKSNVGNNYQVLVNYCATGNG